MKPPASPSPLGPEIYRDPDWFTHEIERVFRRHWSFVGFSWQLAQPDDYLTARVGGVSVVVQNFEGELRAFHNVCSHRHALIRRDACGRGPLRCHYHGWTYDSEGRPVGLPGNQNEFGFEPAEKAVELALKRFEVDRVGDFVFVRLSPGGPALRESLGASAALLDDLEPLHSRPIEEVSENWHANWKICIENTLETYHVGHVHQESLGKVLAPEITITHDNLHSSCSSPLTEASLAGWQRNLGRSKLPHCPKYQGYDHFFIYPNLCIGLTYGVLLSVQTYEPLGPGETIFTYRLLLPETTGGPGAEVIRGVIAESWKEANQQILAEDRLPVELCQAGANEAERLGYLGRSETRIQRFLHNVGSDVLKSE